MQGPFANNYEAFIERLKHSGGGPGEAGVGHERAAIGEHVWQESKMVWVESKLAYELREPSVSNLRRHYDAEGRLTNLKDKAIAGDREALLRLQVLLVARRLRGSPTDWQALEDVFKSGVADLHPTLPVGGRHLHCGDGRPG